MRLVFPRYQIEIELYESRPTSLSIESPILLTEIMLDLWEQNNGAPGDSILSDDYKTYSLAKDCEFIVNPFAVSCNNKRILSQVYKDLGRIIYENDVERVGMLNSAVVTFLEAVTESYPYRLNYDLELNVQGLLKLCAVEIDDASETMIERLSYYVKLMHQICRTEVFIFVNLKQYMTKAQMSDLYRDLMYEHIYLLNIEGKFTYRCEQEMATIIDSDFCRIDIGY